MDTPRTAPGTRLDPWVDAYAARTRGLTAAQVRALFAVASRPEVVSLAGGILGWEDAGHPIARP